MGSELTRTADANAGKSAARYARRLVVGLSYPLTNVLEKFTSGSRAGREQIRRSALTNSADDTPFV